MLRSRLVLLLGVCLLPGCTAVGAWLYDDPSFALSGVALHPRAPGSEADDSLELMFIGCNRNEYELTGDGFATRLAVAGTAVGRGERDVPVRLAMRHASQFSVMLAVARDGFVPEGGRAPWDIVGSSDLQTPIGVRRVDFRLRGGVQRRGEAFEWSTESQGDCRPGLGALPPEFARPPRPIRDDSRPEPRAGYAGSGGNP